MGKFKAALDSGTGKARIQADMALATQIGAHGTPNFFINGRNIRARSRSRSSRRSSTTRSRAPTS